MSLRVGLLSTARINDAVIAGAAASVRDRHRRRLEPDARARRRRTRAEKGLAAGVRLLRGAARLRRRRGLHRASERVARRVGAQGARGRQARARREAADAQAGGGRSALRRRRGGRARRDGGLRVAPRAAGAADRRARRERRARRAALRARSFRWTAGRSGDVRMVRALGGGALLDIGCYCLGSIRTIAGGEPERVEAQQVLGGDGVDVRFAATLRMPGDVLAAFDCSFDEPYRVERGGRRQRRRSCARATRGSGSTPKVHIERDGDDRADRRRHARHLRHAVGRLPRRHRRRADGARPRRDAAAGTVLDALLRAAETGSAVSL